MISVEVVNMDMVDKQLARLALEIREKAVKGGVQAGATIMMHRTKELIPLPGYVGDKPGLKPLRDTIAVLVKVYGDVVVGIVGPKRPEGSHGHLVEYGTKPHMIFARGKRNMSGSTLTHGDVGWIKTLRGMVSRGTMSESQYGSAIRGMRRGAPPKGTQALASDAEGIYGRHVQHPGARGRNFMASSAADTEAQQQRAVVDHIQKLINDLPRT